jgi:transcription initiation factor TFIID TATA-box-binding protein
MFPGLLDRTDVPEVVALLFGSGKLVIARGKMPNDAKEVVDLIVQELEDFALILGQSIGKNQRCKAYE